MTKLNQESSELSPAAKKHQDGRGPSRIPDDFKPKGKGNVVSYDKVTWSNIPIGPAFKLWWSRERSRRVTSSAADPAEKEGGKGGYPIPDEAHDRNDLARVAQHGTPAEKATVRRRVHEKFPDIGKKRSPSHVDGD